MVSCPLSIRERILRTEIMDCIHSMFREGAVKIPCSKKAPQILMFKEGALKFKSWLDYHRLFRIKFSIYNTAHLFQPGLLQASIHLFALFPSLLFYVMYTTKGAARTICSKASRRLSTNTAQAQAPLAPKINSERLWNTLHETCEWGSAHRYGEYVPIYPITLPRAI